MQPHPSSTDLPLPLFELSPLRSLEGGVVGEAELGLVAPLPGELVLVEELSPFWPLVEGIAEDSKECGKLL